MSPLTARFILALALITLALVSVFLANQANDQEAIASDRLDCNSAIKADGEGCVRLISNEPFYAGEKTSFEIKFIVGPSGIPIGGGIAVGIHHSAEIKLSLKFVESVPSGMFKDTKPGLFSNSIYHRLLIATVEDKPLEHGESVSFQFGANLRGIKLPVSSDDHQEFRVTSDINADGVFEKLDHQPAINIQHTIPFALAANSQTHLLVDKKFDITIRMEDRYYNLSKSFDGKVDVYDEHGLAVAKGILLNNGIAHTQLKLSRLGHHRLRLKTQDGQYLGRSNPVRVFKQLPEFNLYFGDLHGHTGTSDGLGESIDDYFKYGRDVAALDFVALTDHGHFDWPGTKAAVKKFHAPQKYVTILGQEAGAGTEHMNLYFRKDDADHISQWQIEYKAFQEWVYQQYNTEQAEVITGPHHFAYDRGKQGQVLYPFGHWDQRVARFVEVYSSHGTSEFIGNPRPLPHDSKDPKKYMQHGLAQGLKFGVIGASDNHDSKPGRSHWGHYSAGLAGIWASSLDRDSLWRSFWNRRVYATSADRIYIDFKINDAPMGREIKSEIAPKLEATIIGKTDILTVEIIKNNKRLKSFDTSNGFLEINYTDESARSEQDFYYLRVTQDNGERGWSTPVWVSDSK